MQTDNQAARAGVGSFFAFHPARPNAITADEIKEDDCLVRWWRGRPFQGGPKSIKDRDVAGRLVALIVGRNHRYTDVTEALQPFQ